MHLFLTITGLTMVVTAWSQPAGSTDYFAEGKKAKTDKNFTLAVENFKKATAQKPTDGEAWYELGYCYNELAKYADAIPALKNAKTYWKDKAQVFYESGYANDFLNKSDDAIGDYKKCLELNENFSGAYRQLGNIYYDIDKDYKTALEHYNHYVDFSLESEISSKTWYKKGYCENEMAQYEDAVMSLKKSVALDNKYASAYDELGFACYKLSHADDAIEAYTASKQLNSASSAPFSGLGDIYRFLKKDNDQAFTNYKKGVELNAKSQNCNYGVGWCYNEKANYEAAIPYLKKAIELNSKYAAAFTELGYAYYALKRYDEALVELVKSAGLFNGSAANYYIGLCYVGKNQKIDAQQIYKKLVDLNSPDADKLLKKINAMQ
jgi:tetratricopeptide (TPR) repeat protein